MKSNKGFTLIELMIVIVILGVLMSAVLPKLTGAQAKGRDTARKADLQNIVAALVVYSGDNKGKYPYTVAVGPAFTTGECLNPGTIVAADVATGLISEYLSKIPGDPKKNNTIDINGDAANDCTGGKYFYKPLTYKGIAGKSFIVCANVEDWKLANYDGNVATAAAPNVIVSLAGAQVFNDVQSRVDDTTKVATPVATTIANANLYCIMKK